MRENAAPRTRVSERVETFKRGTRDTRTHECEARDRSKSKQCLVKASSETDIAHRSCARECSRKLTERSDTWSVPVQQCLD
eukprot:4870945-Pleurochrysis_carterae.AAC.1